MNAVHEFLLANPLLQTGLEIISVVIPLAALLAFAGMGFMSGTARILSITRRRSSYDKCARQLALLGLILGWLLLIGGRVWIFFTQASYTPDSVPGFLVEMSWILLSLAVLLSSLYYTLWKILRNMPVLHVTLGILSGVQGCVAVVAILTAARFLAAFVHPDAAAMTLAEIFPATWSAPLWSAVCYTLPLLLAMPAAFGAALAAPAAQARRFRSGSLQYHDPLVRGLGPQRLESALAAAARFQRPADLAALAGRRFQRPGRHCGKLTPAALADSRAALDHGMPQRRRPAPQADPAGRAAYRRGLHAALLSGGHKHIGSAGPAWFAGLFFQILVAPFIQKKQAGFSSLSGPLCSRKRASMSSNEACGPSPSLRVSCASSSCNDGSSSGGASRTASSLCGQGPSSASR